MKNAVSFWFKSISAAAASTTRAKGGGLYEPAARDTARPDESTRHAAAAANRLYTADLDRISGPPIGISGSSGTTTCSISASNCAETARSTTLRCILLNLRIGFSLLAGDTPSDSMYTVLQSPNRNRQNRRDLLIAHALVKLEKCNMLIIAGQ